MTSKQTQAEFKSIRPHHYPGTRDHAANFEQMICANINQDQSSQTDFIFERDKLIVVALSASSQFTTEYHGIRILSEVEDWIDEHLLRRDADQNL